MKKLILFTIFILPLIFSSSCQNDDDNVNTSTNLQEGDFVVKIDGNELNSSSGFSTISNISNSDLFSIGATFVQNTNAPEVVKIDFAIKMGEILAEANYSFQEDCDLGLEGICGYLAYSTSIVNQGTTIAYQSKGNFNINLSSLDYRSGGNVIGTFSGTVENLDGNGEMITLSEGKFNVTIQ